MYFKCIKYNIQSAHLWQNEATGERTAKTAKLTYTKVGDYYVPDLILDGEPKQDVFYGKYGDLRRTYLKQYKHELWRELAGNGTLKAHLLDIDETANEWMDRMLPQIMKSAGVTEALKACDQMAWVELVNICKAKVEEVIFAELIYS